MAENNAIPQRHIVQVHTGEPDEENGFWAEVLDLPGCFAQGENIAELEANLAEAITAYKTAVAEIAANGGAPVSPHRPDLRIYYESQQALRPLNYEPAGE